MSQFRGRRALLAALSIAMLAPAAASAETISGHVLNADGTPVTDEHICIRPVLGPFGANVPDAVVSQPGQGGAYSITVDPGSYSVTYADCPGPGASTRNDAPTYYGPTGTGTYADAGQVTVTAGHDVTGVDVRLRPGATLTGHVYGGPGSAQPVGACLVLYPTAGPGLVSSTGQSWTDADGAYVFTRLDPEYQYKIRATPCSVPGYVTTWYPAAATIDDATPVSAPATGVDLHLNAVTPDPPAGDTPPADGTGTGTSGTPASADGTTSTNPAAAGGGAPVGGVSVAPPAVPRPAPVAVTAIPRATFGTFGTLRLGTALRSGLRVPVRCAAACAAKVVVGIGAGTAQRLGLPRTLTTGHVRLKAGPTVLVIRLPDRARRALARQRRVAFTVSVTAAGKDLRRTLTLTR